MTLTHGIQLAELKSLEMPATTSSYNPATINAAITTLKIATISDFGWAIARSKRMPSKALYQGTSLRDFK